MQKEYKTTIRMTQETKDLLESLAEKLGCPKSQVITMAIYMLRIQLNLPTKL
jgi:predicted DNA-binding protein